MPRFVSLNSLWDQNLHEFGQVFAEAPKLPAPSAQTRDATFQALFPLVWLLPLINLIDKIDLNYSLRTKRSFAMLLQLFLLPLTLHLPYGSKAWVCFLRWTVLRFVNSKTEPRSEVFPSLSRVQPNQTTSFLSKTVRLQFQSCARELNRGLRFFWATDSSIQCLTLIGLLGCFLARQQFGCRMQRWLIWRGYLSGRLQCIATGPLTGELASFIFQYSYIRWAWLRGEFAPTTNLY